MLVFSWIVLSFVVAGLAGSKSRNSWGWLLFSLLLSPLISLIALLVLGEGTVGKQQCPACKAHIPNDATRCMHCSEEVQSSEDADRVTRDKVVANRVKWGVFATLCVLLAVISLT